MSQQSGTNLEHMAKSTQTLNHTRNHVDHITGLNLDPALPYVISRHGLNDTHKRLDDPRLLFSSTFHDKLIDQFG